MHHVFIWFKFIFQFRLLDLIEDDASSMNLEDIREKYGVSSPHKSFLKDVVNKTITVEKVESSVEVHIL